MLNGDIDFMLKIVARDLGEFQASHRRADPRAQCRERAHIHDHPHQQGRDRSTRRWLKRTHHGRTQGARGKGSETANARAGKASASPNSSPAPAPALAAMSSADRRGRVALNGEVLTTPATVLASLDGVTVDGQPVEAPRRRAPVPLPQAVGFLTAARDPAGRPTIYDALPQGLPRLVPVGAARSQHRGVCCSSPTTDAAGSARSELPASNIPRTYRVRAYGEVRQSDLEQLA
jgi:hypothetical protein